MKINNIDGEVVKDNETYLLKDNTSLNNLVVSSTTLHPGKSTRGHSHPGKEELRCTLVNQHEDTLILVRRRYI